MFGSTILDVAIGIVFVYLLVSLMITALTELLSGWLKWRSANLWLGIQNLVDDAGKSEWVRKVYDHALIQGLSPVPKSTPQSGFAKLVRALFGWLRPQAKGPSYIPSRTFVVALLDSLRQSDPLGLTSLKNGLLAAGAAVPEILPAGKTTADLANDVVARLTALVPDAQITGGTADAVRRDLTALIAAIGSSGYSADDLRRVVLRSATTVPDRYIHDLIVEKIPNTSLGRSLVALFDESDHDLEKLKESLEVWFNSSMDRVSGWYKRKTQLVHLVLAVILTVGLNVDSLLIVRALSSNSALRDSIVAQAKGFAEHAPAAMGNTAGKPPSDATDQLLDNLGVGVNPVGSTAIERAASFRHLETEVDGLNLPVGWLDGKAERSAGRKDDSGFRWWPDWSPDSGETWSGWALTCAGIVRFHFFGWLLTAVAASLGAPFWFDVLNRFITIRASGKAPEEKPKAPKDVPTPLEPGESTMQADLLKALVGGR